MFCPKCGSQLPEEAMFCQKCGAKIFAKEVKQQMDKSVPNAEYSETVSERQSLVKPVTTAGTENQKDSKKSAPKKSKKWILAVIIAIAALIAIAAVSGKSKIDYEATVGAHKPFAVSQGLPYTYEEVFDRYIRSPEWKMRESGDEVYVDINGTLKGTDVEVVVTIKVMPNPENPEGVLIRPDVITLNGIASSTPEEAVQFLYAMFAMYDEGYEDLTDLISQETGNSPSDGGQMERSNAGRKIYYMGDTIQLSLEDGNIAEISFLEWGYYYDYKNDKRVYIECEITNIGTDTFTVRNWFSIYADNYAVDSYMENGGGSLSPNRSTRAKIQGDVNPDSVNVIEVEFADAVLIVKDTPQDAGMQSYGDGIANEYLSGYYVGSMFYDMSISIYSSPEDMIIGNVTMYQDGVAVDTGELYQEDEGTYRVAFYNDLKQKKWYLYPYYKDGILNVDITDENEDYVEVLYMQEHYES